MNENYFRKCNCESISQEDGNIIMKALEKCQESMKTYKQVLKNEMDDRKLMEKILCEKIVERDEELNVYKQLIQAANEEKISLQKEVKALLEENSKLRAADQRRKASQKSKKTRQNQNKLEKTKTKKKISESTMYKTSKLNESQPKNDENRKICKVSQKTKQIENSRLKRSIQRSESVAQIKYEECSTGPRPFTLSDRRKAKFKMKRATDDF